MLPARSHTFALLDDTGVARSEGSGSGWGAPAAGEPTLPELAVELAAGEEYSITLALDASEGPFRECAPAWLGYAAVRPCLGAPLLAMACRVCVSM